MNKNEVNYRGSIGAGNSIYRVIVQDQTGSSGLGTYTIKTGPNHPAGPDLSVLFGGAGDNPWSTYNTIRCATTSTDYIQSTRTIASNFNVVSLDNYGTIETIGTTGIRTTYVLPGLPQTPDSLRIISEINVLGTTAQDSFIEVKTKITNTGSVNLLIGVRYLWDHQIGLDDGPTFKALPDGPELTTEADYYQPDFSQYRMVDNDMNPNPPTFFVYGVTGSPLYPTPIIDVKYASWGNAFSSAYEYTTNESLDIATAGGINDSAVLIYFGHSYIDLAPDETVETTVNIGLTPPVTADLQITADSLPNEVEINKPLTFTLTAKNNGPDDAANVEVKDTLPDNVTFLSANSTKGSCTEAGGIVTCTLDTLSSGSDAVITITVIPNALGEITNTAVISGNDLDPDISNNTVSQTTTVVEQPIRGLKLSEV